MIRFSVVLLVILSLSSIVVAEDLYQVTVESHAAAERLKACGLDAVMRTDDGYLLLVNSAGYGRLARSGLSFRLIATDVKREELAVDIRHDRSNRDRLELLFEAGELRLYRVDPTLRQSLESTPGLAAIGGPLPIVFNEPPTLSLEGLDRILDLDSLIGLVKQDSIESYSTQLESFGHRVTATSGNYLSRNWIIDKLSEFGYDSIIIDSFVTEIYDWPRKVYNVAAIKPGSLYPRHEVIVGAHRDAVPGSPGADDNGSGTVATLEIARVLSAIDVPLTFKFILFDAEEQGLYGSEHYAGAAAQRGDSIVFMLNMDMIAHYENDGESNIYRSTSGDAYAQLWQTLADSLSGINISGYLQSMSGGSDHYPFYANGYAAIFVQERIFSSVYHSAHDSTSNLNFDYFTRMTKASLATAYVVGATYQAAPMLFINYQVVEPALFYPGRDTTRTVTIEEYAGEQLVPYSALLHYSVDGGEYQTAALTDIGPGEFQATIPGQACYSAIEFYFSAEGVGCGPIQYPDSSQPFIAVAATGNMEVFADDFASDLGWTVDSGALRGNWERAQPGAAGYGAPGSDYDHSGMCYLTGPGYAIDVDEGTTTLYSPVINLVAGRTMLQYARWFSNSTFGVPYEDVMRVFISPDGGQSWAIVETVGPVEDADGGWRLIRAWIDDMVTSPAALKIRFAVSDQGDDSQVEAAVDAFRVTQYTCYPLILTEQLPDWTVGMPYSQQLTAVGGEGELSFSDLDNDLGGSGLSLSSDGWLTGAALLGGPISFTAVAVDSAGQSDTAAYVFLINGAPYITTSSLLEATAEHLYEQQLTSSGGTGPLTWSDLNDDLAGAGLALSSNGLIAGTPTDTGLYSFTARVTDATSAFDDQPLNLHVRLFFICGDIDNSGGEPDISDLVYLVDYMFTEGPPPPIMEAADVDASGGDIDISDLVYLVDFMFTGGPLPTCP